MHADISTPQPEPIKESSSNPCGIVGVVLSIIGVCACGLWLFSIPGLILSLIGLRKEPRTTAIVGTIFGGIGIIEFIILGPLMLGILLPALARARDSAKQMVTTSHIQAIESASETFKADNGSYPTSLLELENSKLINPKVTKDAWENAIKLAGGGDTRPVITSAGKDGLFDTDDDLPNQDAGE